MKWFFSLFALVIAAVAIYPFLGEHHSSEKVTGLPWQIKVMDDGSTEVFGIHINHSTVADVIGKLGNDMEMAIVVSSQNAGSLEMYYGHYRAGLLSGKLVLRVSARQEDLSLWRANAVNVDYMASGAAKKFYLSAADYKAALKSRISSITFIPAVNLDESVVLARFGQVKPIRQKGVTHFLYPAKGLDVAIYDDAKDVLQYVEPAAFKQLSAPILSTQ
jgi:hypothetical protein